MMYVVTTYIIYSTSFIKRIKKKNILTYNSYRRTYVFIEPFYVFTNCRNEQEINNILKSIFSFSFFLLKPSLHSSFISKGTSSPPQLSNKTSYSSPPKLSNKTSILNIRYY